MRIPPGCKPPPRTFNPNRAASSTTLTHPGLEIQPPLLATAERNCQDEDENSADEHDQCLVGKSEDLETREADFEARMRSRGMYIKRMAKDGNCLFRCVSDRVNGDPEMHDVVRKLCMDYIHQEQEHFSQYITQNFDAYLRRKRRDQTYGNHIEIQAMSEMYNRPIVVYMYSDEPINSFQAESADGGIPLRLSYHGRNHYNVLVDPGQPDVGVGLGLPGLQPGLADKMQMNKAAHESEQAHLDQQMLLAAECESDFLATQEELEQQVLRDSREAAVRAGLCFDRELLVSEELDTGGEGASCIAYPGASRATSDHIVASTMVEQLVGMGFSLSRVLHAQSQFGDDFDSIVEVLTTT